MKAIEIIETGDPEVLHLVERPQPEITHPEEILVQLTAAGVNPIDTKIRRNGPLVQTHGLPAILGCDGAGVIIAIGAKVTRFKLGDEVWFCHGGVGGLIGNYAEYIILNQSLARFKPEKIDMITAAAAPLVLITAWEALHDRANVRAGQQVLIHAGAGGVGHVAIQLAKIAGARVCTTVSSPEKAAFARELGAELCINYQTENFLDIIMDWTAGQGVDLALDTVGPTVFNQTIPVMKYAGDLVTILNPGPNWDLAEARTRNLRISLELMLTPMLKNLTLARSHQGEILKHCAALIDNSELRIHVNQTFPLANAAEAHRLIEAGHVTGKLALII